MWEVSLLKRPDSRFLMKRASKYQLQNHNKIEFAIREL